MAARRLALMVPLAFGVTGLIFLLAELAPGTTSDRLLGFSVAPAEVRERIAQSYDPEGSALVRYIGWIQALGRGDLGYSRRLGRPVAEALGGALPPTLLLATAALLIHVMSGVLLGLVSAALERRWPDHALTFTSLAVYAMPTFWLGLMAVFVFSIRLGWLPASHMSSAGAHGWPVWKRSLDIAWHLILPACVLGLSSSAGLIRFVRAGLLETLGQPFIRAARARGADGKRVLWRHALRGSLLPLINLVGLSLPVLVSGSLVVEVVFAWPGMGYLTWNAILAEDLAIVAATTLLATLFVAIGNLGADLAMAVADPRIRLDTGGR